MPKIEWDLEAQKKMTVPLGSRELYPNGGVYLAEVLKEHGITVAFGVHGGHIWNLVDAISRIGIKTIVPGHEQNAVYMAEAYSQVTQRPSVVFVTAGPGTSNAVSGVQQAFLSGTPLIVLTGGHELIHDNLHNSLQEDFAPELMGCISKWAQRIVQPMQIKQFTTRAFKLAQAAPRGPVVLQMNASMLTSYFEPWERRHAEYIPQWRGSKTAEPLVCGGDPDDIAEAVKRIYAVDKPFLIIGDGACWAQAGKELEELINLAKIPFTTRRLGRGVMSERHPYYTRGLPPFRNEIELMIPVGVKVGFFDGYGSAWPETIQIAESENHIWSYLNTSVAILGNPKIVARQMIDYIKANNLTPPPGRNEWVKRIQESAEKSRQRRDERALKYKDLPRYKENNFIHWGYLSKVITDYLEERYSSRNRICVDGFTISAFIMPFITAVRPAQVITASEQAGVGHGIGQAIGAAIADIEATGDRTPVVALMGDAGMGVAGTDVEVAVRHKLPIVYIVTNNDGWLTGMKYQCYGTKWEALGEQNQMGANWLGNAIMEGPEKVSGIRWDRVCAEFGAYGESVDRHDDIPAALERCFNAAEKGQPAVLNCVMDKSITNPAFATPLYAISMAHIPWDELPRRGKAVRKKLLGNRPYFKGLANEPEIPMEDPWDPVED